MYRAALTLRAALSSSMNLTAAIEQFLEHRKEKNISSSTFSLYKRLLTDWIEWRERETRPAELESVAVDDFRLFLAALAARELASNTIDSYRRVLRAFWRFLTGEGLLTDEQIRYWENNRIPRPIATDPEPRPYCEEEQFEELLAAAGDGATEKSARDRAILLMLWETGARAGELCALTDAQVDHRRRRALIMGKGRKRGWIFWGPRAAAALLRYIQLRRGPRGGPLIRGCSSRNNGGEMTPNALRLMVKSLGVDLPKGAPVHFLRHAFAHRNLDAGLETSQVQQLMRHSSIETTLRYLKERPDKLQELHRRGLGLRPEARKRRAGEE